LGVARTQELHYLQDADRAGSIQAGLSSLLESGEVIECRVAGFPNIAVFALKEALGPGPAIERKRYALSFSL